MTRLAWGLLLLLMPWQASLGGERLVLIGHQLTEVVFALGAGERVVGVHGYVDHVAGAEALPRLRGPRQTSAEGVLSLRPTQVWAMEGRGTPEMFERLERVGVPVTLFGGEWTLDDVPERILEVASALGESRAGERLAEQFMAELAAASTVAAGDRPRAIFVLGGGGRPLLVAGDDTTVAEMIALAGGENVTEHSGYRLLSAEEVMRRAPELILMLPDAVGDGEVPVILALPGLRHTPAAQDGHWQVVPGHCISGGMGLSTPDCIRAIRTALNGEER